MAIMLSIRWRWSKASAPECFNRLYSIDGLVQYVSEQMKHRCYENSGRLHNKFEQKRNDARQELLLNALRRCTYGSSQDKAYVKSVIRDILVQSNLNREKLLTVLPYSTPTKLEAMDCFDCMLHHYSRQYGEMAFSHLVKTYSLDIQSINEDGDVYYEINHDMIMRAYMECSPVLSDEDVLEILIQRIYQCYKGFSVIDHIREMAIDGISGGVSGFVGEVPDLANQPEVLTAGLMSFDSVWVFYEGKSIHLSFMSFGSEAELKRVCQNIYRYNNVGMLSKDVGYKINDMVDGSRVVVVRPDFSESWAFFIRKFHIRHIGLERLIQGSQANLAVTLLRFLIKGGCITAVTGSQGSGKTTLLMALVGEIYQSLTLRIQETAFELQLRRIYPRRNILTFRETRSISGQQGLDLQKKTDGCVNILGEVATDEVAAWMVQMAQVASLFTLFTHHAKTTSDLVLSIRNSLLKCDVFRDESVAEEQVVGVLNFDIHLTKDYSGHRFIERVTEIVPVDDSKRRYSAVDILRWEGDAYRWIQPITGAQHQRMKEMMTPKDRDAFDVFMSQMNGGESIDTNYGSTVARVI